MPTQTSSSLPPRLQSSSAPTSTTGFWAVPGRPHRSRSAFFPPAVSRLPATVWAASRGSRLWTGRTPRGPPARAPEASHAEQGARRKHWLPFSTAGSRSTRTFTESFSTPTTAPHRLSNPRPPRMPRRSGNPKCCGTLSIARRCGPLAEPPASCWRGSTTSTASTTNTVPIPSAPVARMSCSGSARTVPKPLPPQKRRLPWSPPLLPW
mmetsp:Transcript_3217/g.8910  ORF Transcript_3217/g.8910 Transcript_3217/m.8910 type:complete len:208 (-) Transcript_3217:185-808(-)